MLWTYQHLLAHDDAELSDGVAARSQGENRCSGHINTSLLTTMLNYLMLLLPVHKERTDALDMQAILTEFIGESDHKCDIFVAYI